MASLNTQSLMENSDTRPVGRDSQLVRELTWVLIVKSAALFLIWLAFFSHPSSASLSATQIHNTIFSAAPAEANTLTNTKNKVPTWLMSQ